MQLRFWLAIWLAKRTKTFKTG